MVDVNIVTISIVTPHTVSNIYNLIYLRMSFNVCLILNTNSVALVRGRTIRPSDSRLSAKLVPTFVGIAVSHGQCGRSPRP
jgi:hypothetical protein